MKKTKSNIAAYDPAIYPLILYVGTSDDAEDAKEMFKAYYTIDNMAEDRNAVELDDFDATTTGITSLVRRKDTGVCGILVLLNIDKHVHNTIPHESVHVADAIYEFCGIPSQNFRENEGYAYLVGWIAGRMTDYTIIQKTKNND